jgi:hypothetical protein
MAAANRLLLLLGVVAQAVQQQALVEQQQQLGVVQAGHTAVQAVVAAATVRLVPLAC